MIFALWMILLLAEFCREAQRRIKFNHGSDKKAQNPFVVMQDEHQHAGNDKKQRTENLLPKKTLDNKVVAPITVGYLLEGKQNGT